MRSTSPPTSIYSEDEWDTVLSSLGAPSHEDDDEDDTRHFPFEDIIQSIKTPDRAVNNFWGVNVISDTLEIRHTSKLVPAALASLRVPNAGGKSEVSEMWSIQHLSGTLKADPDVLLEMDIHYWCEYKMVDYILTVSAGDQSARVGVSVTRAMSTKTTTSKLRSSAHAHRRPESRVAPPILSKPRWSIKTSEEYTRGDAQKLLLKKLNGLIVSRNTVVKAQSFYRSILHIFAPTPRVAELLMDVIASGDLNIPSLEIVGSLDIWITTCRFSPIYTNG